MSPLGCGRPSRYGTSGCIPAVVNNTEGSSLGTREALGMAACARSVKNDRYIVRSLSAVSTPNSSPPSLECARGGTRPTRGVRVRFLQAAGSRPAGLAVNHDIPYPTAPDLMARPGLHSHELAAVSR